MERLLVTSAAGTLEIYQDLAPLLGVVLWSGR